MYAKSPAGLSTEREMHKERASAFYPQRGRHGERPSKALKEICLRPFYFPSLPTVLYLLARYIDSLSLSRCARHLFHSLFFCQCLKQRQSMLAPKNIFMYNIVQSIDDFYRRKIKLRRNVGGLPTKKKRTTVGHFPGQCVVKRIGHDDWKRPFRRSSIWRRTFLFLFLFFVQDKFIGSSFVCQ